MIPVLNMILNPQFGVTPGLQNVFLGAMGNRNVDINAVGAVIGGKMRGNVLPSVTGYKVQFRMSKFPIHLSYITGA